MFLIIAAIILCIKKNETLLFKGFLSSQLMISREKLHLMIYSSNSFTQKQLRDPPHMKRKFFQLSSAEKAVWGSHTHSSSAGTHNPARVDSFRARVNSPRACRTRLSYARIVLALSAKLEQLHQTKQVISKSYYKQSKTKPATACTVLCWWMCFARTERFQYSGTQTAIKF